MSTVTVKAKPPPSISEPVGSSTTSSVDIPQEPGVSITKTASRRTSDLGINPTIFDAGDILFYVLQVTNIGNTWLSAVEISDSLLEKIVCVPDLSRKSSRFVVGAEAIRCTASAVTGQSMINAGFMESTAQVW